MVAHAEAVRRLKAAGAIILGKTNCPDMSSSVETDNLVFGLTRNPWNLEHSAGGSSGGEVGVLSRDTNSMGSTSSRSARGMCASNACRIRSSDYIS